MAGFMLTAQERSEGDCMRVAVTQCYGTVHGFSYGDTPDLAMLDEDGALRPGTEQQAVWEAWALERRLRWWMSCEVAPVHLAAWLGSVDSRAHRGAHHVIAFTHERPLLREGDTFAETTVADVREAKWLLPAGVAMPPGRLRRITRPMPGKPTGIHYQVEIEGTGRSTWKRHGDRQVR